VVSSSVGAERPDDFPSLTSEPQVTGHVDRPTPPRSGRWLLAVVMIAVFFGAQILAGLIAVMYFIGSGQFDAGSQDEMMRYLSESQTGLLITVGAAALGALLTILVGFTWPWLWSRVLNGGRYPLADWIAWRPLKNIPGWLVAVMTIPLLLIIAVVVTMLFGESSVDAQLMLFEGPLLQYLTPVVVALIVPLAEEVVFRGALYSAILPKSADPANPEAGWQRHIVPFIVTSIAFGVVHLAAGFEKPGSIVQIMVLSMYLTALRSYTGSMKASVIGHMTWNGLGAIMIVLYNMGVIPETF
jgi:membrane protease YdiL (CAAX protease family)